MVKLVASNISVSIGKSLIVDKASLTINGGEVATLVGANGVGKSTLLKAIAQQLPSTGTIKLQAANGPVSPELLHQEIAYMPQDIGAVSSLTVLEVILLGRLRQLGFALPKNLIEEAISLLENFDLSHLQARPISALSGGQRQIVFLAQTIFRKPNVLLLDEPTAALDLRHQLLVLESVRNICREQGMAVLLVMHDLSLATQFSDTVFCMKQGRIIADGPVDETITSDMIHDLYQVEAEIARTATGRLSIIPVAASS